MSLTRGLVTVASGALFGIGLGMSGMTRPARIIGFLDVTGSWDPSLVLVMVGAIAVYLPAYWIITRRKHPIMDVRFWLPTRTEIDTRLIIGASIFGIGWGIGGICPGPAIAAVGTGYAPYIVFAPAMALGMIVHNTVTSAVNSRGQTNKVRESPCG